jgi:hypothetical protein
MRPPFPNLDEIVRDSRMPRGYRLEFVSGDITHPNDVATQWPGR